MSIYSVAFVVNGREQVVRDGGTLEALPGDEVLIAEVEICADGVGGGVGRFVWTSPPWVGPVGRSAARPGPPTFSPRLQVATVAGPPSVWTVGEDWRGGEGLARPSPPGRQA